MRVLICDDEQKMIDLEVSMLQKYCQSANVIATFYAFTDSLSAENTDEFDIAFLDIDMAELNGIELARRLRLKNPTAVIIFVTNFIQYSQCIKPLNVGALIIWISLQHTWQKNS